MFRKIEKHPLQEINSLTMKGMLLCKYWGIIVCDLTMAIVEIGSSDTNVVTSQLLVKSDVNQPSVDSICIWFRKFLR